MDRKLNSAELQRRLKNFCEKMDTRHQDWDTVLIVSKVNQYYFTGTMQEGLLVIKRGEQAVYFVRRSFERAQVESCFENICLMQSFRDAIGVIGTELGKTYIESEILTYAYLERIKKYFKISDIGAADAAVLAVRAVKSPYELAMLEESGRRHNDFLRHVVPGLLNEGMSEIDLVGALYQELLRHGHHGVTRFQMFQTDLGVGQVAFGENALYPTNFDGPTGSRGMSPAVPIMGSRERKLKKGDTVFLDVGFGLNGYQTDKSQAYIFGAQPTAEMVSLQRACIEIQKRTAELLIPGARPSDIYKTVMGELSDDFKCNFMGYGSRTVKFLGHGIGLNTDEPPVIAIGFDEPLEENMVFAIEPKKGVEGVGLLGVEDDYVVTKDGAKCITGGGCDIIVV